MYIAPEVRRWLWAVPVAVAVLCPGWEGRLVPVPHEEALVAARAAPPEQVFGVERAAQGDTRERWHAQYLGGGFAGLLRDLNLRGLTTYLVPPDYVAYLPPPTVHKGIELAPTPAAYYRVETACRWPWWWPGGGVAWDVPE